MPRYSCGFLATGAGVAGATTGRPMASIMGAAAAGGQLVSISVANTTAFAVQLRIVRITAAGTPGTAMTENVYTGDAAAPSLTVAQAHSADATFTADALDYCQLGAAVGSGWIFNFGGNVGGIEIDKSTASGVGILPVGTAQICTCTFVWDE